jgi:hypothetical protein
MSRGLRLGVELYGNIALICSQCTMHGIDRMGDALELVVVAGERIQEYIPAGGGH